MANQSACLPCLGQTFLHRITNHAPMHCTQTVSAPSLTVPTATAHILRRLNKRPRHLVASASRSPGLSRLALARLLLRFPHGTQSVFFTTMCNFLFTFSAAHYTITVPPCPCSSRLRALKQNKKTDHRTNLASMFLRLHHGYLFACSLVGPNMGIKGLPKR